jgi:hypothetical protein
MLNKNPFATDANAWRQSDPATITNASFAEIAALLPLVSPGGTRRLGVTFPVSLFDTTAQQTVAFVSQLLNVATANGFAVGVALDSFEFWDARPDLWNWWNASEPGYNPANVANVEWTGWAADNATTIAWRNWGSQFRVPPHPNLASAAVVAAAQDALRPVTDAIAGWLSTATPQQQASLAYVKVRPAAGCRKGGGWSVDIAHTPPPTPPWRQVGWEVAIGTNFFYYPGGNALRPLPPAQDPTSGIGQSQQVQLGRGREVACGPRGGGSQRSVCRSHSHSAMPLVCAQP